MKIAIGSDHRGFRCKQDILSGMSEISWLDVGCYDDVRTDYPLYAHQAMQAIQNGKADQAVLLCGTGIGMAIVANRFRGVYAGVVWNATVARLAREDDNINVVVIPADFVSSFEAIEIIKTWYNAEFKQERYAQRLAMIDEVK